MKKGQFRGFWDAVAAGREPTPADVRAEGFKADHVRTVRRQALDILEVRAGGHLGDARRLARELSVDWEHRYADDLDWSPPAPDDPRELAAKVRR
jgi:hypothetical protein